MSGIPILALREPGRPTDDTWSVRAQPAKRSLEHERLDSRGEQSLHSITDQWQRAGDTRLFKIILSPEDGASVDFRAASRDMIRALEQRTGEQPRMGRDRASEYRSPTCPHHCAGSVFVR